MSFRARLTLFFLLIVVVPMVAVTIVVYALIDDSANGKTDARLATAQTTAMSVYRAEQARAGGVVRSLARNQALFDPRAVARARAQLRGGGVRRIVVTQGGRVLGDAGDRDAVASRAIAVRVGTRTVEVQAATITARDYVARVRELTGLPVAVRLGSRFVASQGRLPGGDLPRRGKVSGGGKDYRVTSFGAPGFRGAPVRVTVFAKAGGGSSAHRARLLAAGMLLAFLLIAFIFAAGVSRSLQAQIAGFLSAARRLAGGDFSTEVPIEGRDEFAALGEEFNKMSRQLEARLDELRQERARLEESIRRIGDTFASNLDREGLLEIVVQVAVDALDASGGRVATRAGTAGELEERASAGDLAGLGSVVEAVEAEALERDAPAESSLNGHSALTFPVHRTGEGGEILGLVSVARSGRAFTPGERELFNYLVGRAAVSIENVGLHEVVQRQAVTDDLTGLFNHRRFQKVVAQEVERARRFEQELGLVLLDIDDFKEVNDTHGHQQGDLVLREVARILRESSREIDEPARYGGEELAVALPQTDLEGAYNLAERVRTGIEALRIPRLDGKGVLSVSASFGVAAVPDCAEDKEALIMVADAALYRAKRAGKNRTERAAPLAANSPGAS
jgi:diguanylate cyclase (GGDEF)-like protein